jgi:hypothetical protein
MKMRRALLALLLMVAPRLGRAAPRLDMVGDDSAGCPGGSAEHDAAA